MQTHKEHNNITRTQTVGATALRPKGNSQGSFYFLSLTNGHRIDICNWTDMPMLNEVIDHIHALERHTRAADGITFVCRDGTPILDDEDDDNDMASPDYNPDHCNSEDDDDYDSDYEDDGNDDAGANDPQHIAVVWIVVRTGHIVVIILIIQDGGAVPLLFVSRDRNKQ